MATEIKVIQEKPKVIKFSEIMVGDGFQYKNGYFIKTMIHDHPEHTNAMCVTKYIQHGKKSREFGELMTFDLNTGVIPTDMTIVVGTVDLTLLD